jgi:hypothetical protein
VKPPRQIYALVNQDRAFTLGCQIVVVGTARDGAACCTPAAWRKIAASGSCPAKRFIFMRLAIDSVFLDSQLRARKLRSNLQPFRIAVCMRYSVHEPLLGTVERSGAKLGDHLSFTACDLN